MLLHGWTVTADLNWFPSYAPLGRRFRVLALDLRGHGRGLRSWRPFRLEDCADDVAALADAIGVERLIAVGYSMGGPVAELLWRRHPERVEGLVLCATAARFTSRDLTSNVFLAGLAGLSLASRLTPDPIRRSLADAFIDRRLAGSPIRDWATAELARNDPTAVIEAGVAVRSFDATGWIDQVDAPTAVVVTGMDRVVSPSRQMALAGSVPGATCHEIDGDHSVCVGDPRRFVPVLLEATSSVANRAAAAATAGGSGG